MVMLMVLLTGEYLHAMYWPAGWETETDGITPLGGNGLIIIPIQYVIYDCPAASPTSPILFPWIDIDAE